MKCKDAEDADAADVAEGVPVGVWAHGQLLLNFCTDMALIWYDSDVICSDMVWQMCDMV